MRCPWLFLAAWLLAGCPATSPSTAGAGAPSAAALAAPVLTLAAAQPLTDGGGHLSPAWSADGAWVSFTGPGYRGLHAIPATGGEATLLADPAEGAWFRHRWLDDPPRIRRTPRGNHPALDVPLDGTGAEEVTGDGDGPAVFARRDAIVVREGEREWAITRGEDRFFDPRLSPYGDQVAAVGLTTGVHVLDAIDGTPVAHGGPGTHPVWTPDGEWVLFERALDDGYRIVDADLWALHVASGGLQRLTATPGVIEQQAAVSPDGIVVAYARDGAIWTASLEEVVP